MRAVMVERHGGVEVLRCRQIETPLIGVGQVLVKVTVAGVNVTDIAAINGTCQQQLPFTPGVEGAGCVLAVGPGVTHVRAGDRVCWFSVLGSYAEQLAAPAEMLVPLPDRVDCEMAASILMQGLTASHFATETFRIKPGDVALVHSAAGGVGLLLTQIIKILGGKVIAIVSSPHKVCAPQAAGAEHVIVARDGSFSEEVRRLTDGEGVHVVYGGAETDTFKGSLQSLRHHGVLAYDGQAIKRLPQIDVLDLPRSVHVTYARVHDHVRTRDSLIRRSSQLFDWVARGQLKHSFIRRYTLADAALAHHHLASGHSIGKHLLLP